MERDEDRPSPELGDDDGEGWVPQQSRSRTVPPRSAVHLRDRLHDEAVSAEEDMLVMGPGAASESPLSQFPQRLRLRRRSPSLQQELEKLRQEVIAPPPNPLQVHTPPSFPAMLTPPRTPLSPPPASSHPSPSPHSPAAPQPPAVAGAAAAAPVMLEDRAPVVAGPVFRPRLAIAALGGAPLLRAVIQPLPMPDALAAGPALGAALPLPPVPAAPRPAPRGVQDPPEAAGAAVAAEERRKPSKSKFTGWGMISGRFAESDAVCTSFGKAQTALVFRVGDCCPILRSLWSNVLHDHVGLPSDLVPLVLSFYRAGCPAPVRVAERTSIAAVDRNQLFWTRFHDTLRAQRTAASSRSRKSLHSPPQLLRTISYRRPKDREKAQEEPRRRHRTRYVHVFREAAGQRMQAGMFAGEEQHAARAVHQIASALHFLHEVGAPMVTLNSRLLFSAAMVDGTERRCSLKLFPCMQMWDTEGECGPELSVLPWCAPEKLEEFKAEKRIPAASPESVVWALGVLAYELALQPFSFAPATAEEAVAWGTHPEFAKRHLRFPPGTSEALRDFVTRCLRPATVKKHKRLSLKDVVKHRWFSECPAPTHGGLTSSQRPKSSPRLFTPLIGVGIVWTATAKWTLIRSILRRLSRRPLLVCFWVLAMIALVSVLRRRGWLRRGTNSLE
eukprot:Hpha_TRINITY_DN16312_c1_g3::TRINITY_DN16312_c1_g3_i1::g.59594::m.59594